MSLDNKPIYTGGCQCGAVRFRVEGAIERASICHCRMCQKAFGSFYAPLASLPEGSLTWTRGEPKRFRSSDIALRGFCAECGTPLTMEDDDGVALAIGAFDNPASVVPEKQWGIENKLPYADAIPELPGFDTDITIAHSFQHPDYETEVWPLESKQ